MDLEIRVRDQVIIVDRYQEAERIILDLLKHWQAFEDMEQPLTIVIRGLKSNDPPLAVTVSDAADTNDIFGRR